jgi:hypothetical protein
MRLFIPVAVVIVLSATVPMVADASWTEGGATILTLDEIMLRLGTALGQAARTTLPGDTPVLLPRDSDIDSPKTIQIALVQSGLALRSQESGWIVVDAYAKSESARARTRLLPIAPQRSLATGPNRIQSGGAVLFGEVIPPPYSVEVVNEVVEVNGVAVFPVSGADVAPPEPTKAQIASHDGMDAAATNYERNLSVRGITQAKQLLIDELSRLPGVTGAEWLDDETVRLIRPGGDGEIITFARTGRDADPPTEDALEETLRIQAEALRDALRENATIFCGATYLLTNATIDAATLRARIEQVLDSGESDALRISRLQAYTGHRDAAADLLFARIR